LRPRRAQVKFGAGKRLPPLRVMTHKSREVLLSGQIDRVDLVGNDRMASVIDYRLSETRLPLVDAFWGKSLSLLTAVLALMDGSEALGRPFQPIGFFFVPLQRKIEDQDPEGALMADDPNFPLKVKQRGLIDERYLQAFDRTLTPGDKSHVVEARLDKKYGEVCDRGRSDVLTPEQYRGLLAHTREKMIELADRLIDGDVSIHPYRIGKSSVCGHCGFRDVCRFEPAVNGYFLPSVTRRDEVVEALQAKGEETRS